MLADGVSVGTGDVVGAGAKLGAGAEIGANAVIGEAVEIGERTRIGAGASVSHAIIGARVFLYPGVRIGQPGFGFEMDGDGRSEESRVGNECVSTGSSGWAPDPLKKKSYLK